MSELRTDFKDEILQEGETHRVYNIKRKGTDEVVESEVYLEKAYEALQEGDEFGAKDVNEIHVRLNGLASMNLFINGDFRVWQRGKTISNVDGAKYTADRWQWNNSVSGGIIVAKVDGIDGMYVECKSACYCELTYKIEDKSALLNKDLTLSFYSTKEGVGAQFGTVRLTSENDYIAITNAGVVVETGTNPNLLFMWGVDLTAGEKFNITNIKLEQGSIATPLVPRPYGEELALCQRYYQTCEGRLLMGMYNDENADGQYYFPVEMRITPSVSFNYCEYYDYTLGWVAPQSIGLSAYQNSKYISCRLQRGANDTFSEGLTLNARLKFTMDAEIY